MSETHKNNKSSQVGENVLAGALALFGGGSLYTAANTTGATTGDATSSVILLTMALASFALGAWVKIRGTQSEGRVARVEILDHVEQISARLMEKMERRINSLEDKLTHCETEHEAARNELARLEVLNSASRRKIEELEARVDSLVMESDARRLRDGAQIEKLKDELRAARDRIKELETILEAG